MSIKILLASAALLAPLPALAQTEPAATEKSAAQITCELSGDCAAADAEDATMAKPEERGFSIARPGATPARPAAAPAARPTRQAFAVALPTAAITPGRAAPIARQPIATRRSRLIEGRAPAVTPVGRSTLAIAFDTNSASLTAAGLSQARRLLESLQGSNLITKRFIVAGHTDSVGDRSYNLELSRRRAQTLVDFLVANGVERARLEPKGYGPDQPIIGVSASDGANRRVEIVKIN